MEKEHPYRVPSLVLSVAYTLSFNAQPLYELGVTVF